MSSPDDPHESKRHRKQAQELVTAAHIAALVQYPTFVGFYPCLGTIDSLHLGLIVGVAGVIVGTERLEMLKFTPCHKKELLNIILDELGKEPGALEAFKDCQTVVHKEVKRLKAAGHGPDHILGDALGIWIVRSMVGGREPSNSERKAAQDVGRVTEDNFENWWTSGIAPGLAKTFSSQDLPHFQYGKYERVEELLAKAMAAGGAERKGIISKFLSPAPGNSLEGLRCHAARVLVSRQSECSRPDSDVLVKNPDCLARQSLNLVSTACILGDSMYVPMVNAFPSFKHVDLHRWRETVKLAGVLTGVAYLRLLNLELKRRRQLLGYIVSNLDVSPVAGVEALTECEHEVLVLAERLGGSGIAEQFLYEYALGDWIACQILERQKLSREELEAGRMMAVTGMEFFADWWGVKGKAQ